jgi:hypothetical protein
MLRPRCGQPVSVTIADLGPDSPLALGRTEYPNFAAHLVRHVEDGTPIVAGCLAEKPTPETSPGVGLQRRCREVAARDAQQRNRHRAAPASGGAGARL